VLCHMTKSHDECGKIVHRLYSSYISSIQEINEDSIEIPLSTRTWRVIKLSRLSCYSPVKVFSEVISEKRYKQDFE